MVVSELQHRLDELSLLKTNETMAKAHAAAKTKDNNDDRKVGNTSLVTRINPFNFTEKEPSQTVSFFELHEKYGQILQSYFRPKNGELETDQTTK